MSSFKTPKQGDIVILKSSKRSQPHIYRPFLVLSRHVTNASGMIECMPIISNNSLPEPYASFMVKANYKINGQLNRGYVFTFRLTCYDMLSRQGQIVGHMNDEVLDKCLFYARSLIAKA